MGDFQFATNRYDCNFKSLAAMTLGDSVILCGKRDEDMENEYIFAFNRVRLKLKMIGDHLKIMFQKALLKHQRRNF